MQQRILLGYAVALGLGAWACGTKVTVKRGVDDSGANVASATTTNGAGGTTTTNVTIVASTTGVGGSGGRCIPEVFDAEHPAKPIDAIVVADNGFDMSAALYALELDLYGSFVAPLEQAGVDVQTIVISNHGPSAEELCIGPPLSDGMGCNGAPGDVPGKFHHYSELLFFGDPLCKLLSTLQGSDPDEFGVPSWLPWLRQEALKAFVLVTNDMVSCTHGVQQYYDSSTVTGGQAVATQWDAALLASAPAQFGTTAARNYIFEALIGVAPKVGDAPYQPQEAVTTSPCGFSQPGTGYQWLSKGTGALRSSVCSTGSYSSILLGMADDALRAASDRCQVYAPLPPSGQDTFLQFYPSGGGVLQFSQVASAAQCGAWNFYFEDGVFHLCESTCDYVTADAGGDMQVVYDCPIKG